MPHKEKSNFAVQVRARTRHTVGTVAIESVSQSHGNPAVSSKASPTQQPPPDPIYTHQRPTRRATHSPHSPALSALFYFCSNPRIHRPHGGRANPTSPNSLMGPTVVASRKREADAFLGDPFDLPRLTKRGRCSASAAAADLGLSFPLESDPVEALQLIFPGADPQVRQRTCARADRFRFSIDLARALLPRDCALL
jgi:hypothetical protein